MSDSIGTVVEQMLVDGGEGASVEVDAALGSAVANPASREQTIKVIQRLLNAEQEGLLVSRYRIGCAVRDHMRAKKLKLKEAIADLEKDLQLGGSTLGDAFRLAKAFAAEEIEELKTKKTVKGRALPYSMVLEFARLSWPRRTTRTRASVACRTRQ